MGEFQARTIYFLVFLALFACNCSLLCHGRPLKPVNSPIMPNQDVATSGDAAGASYTNAFEPTTPGNSPGVGHRSFAGEDNKMVAAQSPDVGVSVTQGSESDFKPTDPGHSPGVGHAYQEKIGHLN
ncbi:precursor of CEP9 [Lotus japonicus]|uniref:precursor of CEP9 n=1 Tax=Lotus japonicus TaxID=34305 RepID=UPI00085ED2F7|nr:precursor of CEP9 [Lotus japonicus]